MDLKVVSQVLGFHNNWHHDMWYDILDNRLIQDKDTKKLVLNRLGRVNKKIILLAPREHAKSTVFTVNYPLGELLRNPNLRILIVSSTLGQAQAFLREIKGHIEREDLSRNIDFLRVFGNLMPQYPEKWTDKEIIIDRTDLRIKDPSLVAIGAGGAILSRRADLIIADDILSPDNSRTVDQRNKIRRWFHQVLSPVLTPTGRLVVVGTTWNEDDLYNDFLDDNTFDVKIRMQAVVREECLNEST